MDRCASETGYHEGELKLQKMYGTEDFAEGFRGFLVRDIDMGRNQWFHDLQTLQIASLDRSGRIWVSEVSGKQGFIHAIDKATLRVNVNERSIIAGDPLRENLDNSEDRRVAMIMLNYSLQSRYRLNGYSDELTSTESGEIQIHSEEAFKNCPRYIQRREIVGEREQDPQSTHRMEALSDRAIEMLKNADTFYIGTMNPNGHLDVSHRGGNPGFVRVKSPTELVWPEYGGNGMFMTLGNIERDEEKRCGLLFVDYEGSGSVLQLVGNASLGYDERSFEGVCRVLSFTLQEAVLHESASTYEWRLVERSHYNPPLKNQSSDSSIMTKEFPMDVEVARVEEESANVTNVELWLPSRISFLPGQYGIFQVVLPDRGTVERTWTISSTPRFGNEDYTIQISVRAKPDGLVSNWIRNHLKVLSEMTLVGIGGDFSPYSSRMAEFPSHIALISAGIGVTPMVSMLRGMEARRTASSTVVIHSEREEQNRPFSSELKRLQEVLPNMRLELLLTGKETKITKSDATYSRISVEILQGHLESNPDSWSIFLCGPPGFMRDTADLLEQVGVHRHQIQTEDFDF